MKLKGHKRDTLHFLLHLRCTKKISAGLSWLAIILRSRLPGSKPLAKVYESSKIFNCLGNFETLSMVTNLDALGFQINKIRTQILTQLRQNEVLSTWKRLIKSVSPFKNTKHMGVTFIDWQFKIWDLNIMWCPFYQSEIYLRSKSTDEWWIFNANKSDYKFKLIEET